MYFYRGAIYLDYWMMSFYNSSISNEVSAYGEEKMNEASYLVFFKMLRVRH